MLLNPYVDLTMPQGTIWKLSASEETSQITMNMRDYSTPSHNP